MESTIIRLFLASTEHVRSFDEWIRITDGQGSNVHETGRVNNSRDRMCFLMKTGSVTTTVMVCSIWKFIPIVDRRTNNGVKHNSAPVMPQNKLEHAIVTLDFNATVKAQNTSIMLCQKLMQGSCGLITPTSGHVTDVCESMLQTEWKRSEDWIVPVPYTHLTLPKTRSV